MLQLGEVRESIAGGNPYTSQSYTYSDEDGTMVGVEENYNKNSAYLLWV